MELRTRVGVLPVEKESQEFDWRDRLDLLAQSTESQAVNAREQSSIAPVGAARYGKERAAERLSVGFEPGERSLDAPRRQRQALGERVDGGRSDHAHPAA